MRKLEEACFMLKDMESRGCNPNFTVYSTLVSYLQNAGKLAEALEADLINDKFPYFKLSDSFPFPSFLRSLILLLDPLFLLCSIAEVFTLNLRAVLHQWVIRAFPCFCLRLLSPVAPQAVASLAEQFHAFQDKVSDDITGMETQLSKLSVDLKDELVQAPTHRAKTDLAITKLQDSVQLLINHFQAGHAEPASTSALLSSSFTPTPKSGLLPNPPVDQKLKAVPYDMPHSSTALSLDDPKAQLEPLFSFGSLPPPHYTQHTTGPSTVPHDQGTHPPRQFDNDVIRHIKPIAPTFDGRGDPTMFLDWVQAMEDYFAWYNLTDAHKLRIGKMTLQGAARQYWNSVEEQLYQFGQPPVTLWDEMKLKLREQYLPTFYRHQLYDQLWTLSQGSLTVTEFQARFIEHKIRAGIREELDITMSRFIHGLRDDIKCEVRRFRPHILEDAYCHALEAETFLGPQRRYTGYFGLSSIPTPNRSTHSSTYGVTGPPAPTVPTIEKGPAPYTAAHIECYRCHAKGHIASRCPHRILTISSLNEDSCVDVYVEPLEPIYDPELDKCCEEACHQVSVMHCIYSASTPPPPDSWKRTSIFQTYVPCSTNRCQLVIDRGSTLNVISKAAVDCLHLQAEPYPHPFHADHGFTATVRSCDRENTYTFQHEGKNITLTPSNPAVKPTKDVQPTLLLREKASEHRLSSLSSIDFAHDLQDTGVFFALLLKSESDSNPTPLAKPIHQFLPEFSNIIPDDLPDELPPTREIQLAIDLIPGSQIPDVPYYRMNPSAQVELNKLIRFSLPPKRMVPGEGFIPLLIPRSPSPSSDPTDQIEDVSDHEVLASSPGDSTRSLVRWVGRPATANTWIIEVKFRQLDSTLLHNYQDSLHGLDLAASRPPIIHTYKHRHLINDKFPYFKLSDSFPFPSSLRSLILLLDPWVFCWIRSSKSCLGANCVVMKKMIVRGRELGSAMVMRVCNGVGWDCRELKEKMNSLKTFSENVTRRALIDPAELTLCSSWLSSQTLYPHLKKLIHPANTIQLLAISVTPCTHTLFQLSLKYRDKEEEGNQNWNQTVAVTTIPVALKIAIEFRTRSLSKLQEKTMKVNILQWHAVASWTWDAQDETCGICRMAFDGCCPACKLPGDDCPLIWGACNHAFHLHCILKWVNSQTSQAHCPMCRREWQFKGIPITKAFNDTPMKGKLFQLDLV
ncbi:anaphase-promoting complex/cyclosome 11 [Prunus dulcis]|uniref:Anaphase-promoting complex subunit 11 n=2 Tax=Prunus TaxID=3754 RepID=A0A4Y1QYQ1_PRUDU|nr:anaphase-promoting complex/cyclosome 11 [Prunus dulcis]